MDLSNFDINYVFPTAIGKIESLLPASELSNLKSNIRSISSSTYETKHNWLSGLNSPLTTFGTSFVLERDEFKSIISALTEVVNTFLRAHSDNTELVCSEAWLNIYSSGTFQEPHSHAYPSLVSAVFYIQADEESGRIVFQCPFSQSLIESNFISENPLTDTVRWYQPKENMALVFKSSLSHYVLPSNNELPRISIAANFSEK